MVPLGILTGCIRSGGMDHVSLRQRERYKTGYQTTDLYRFDAELTKCFSLCFSVRVDMAHRRIGSRIYFLLQESHARGRVEFWSFCTQGSASKS